MIILIILIIVLLLSFTYIKNIFKSETTILDDVKLKEEEPSNNGFALMLQKEDGTYEESTSSTWPIDMVFNSEKSGCVDVNNNIIEDVLEYDSTNNIMNVSVGETAYCYVYFDIATIENLCIGKNLGNCLIENNDIIDSLNDNIEGGLYRYQGNNKVVKDNYICFGVSDKEECINDTDKYMYRIIGIDENGQIKVIKNTSIGSYKWHSNSKTDAPWPESDLFKGLNGIDGGYYTNLFVNNSTYTYMEEDSNWYNKIATTKWKYGVVTSVSIPAANLYATENDWPDYVNAKIGIWYLHDYYYAYQSGGLNCSSSHGSCTNAWTFLGSDAWTMSRNGNNYGGKTYYAWIVSSDGQILSAVLGTDSYNIVRPVFFLTSNVEYLMGTGTIDDPFIIKE